MNRDLKKILPKCIVSLLFLWFFVVGGCDVEFGSGGNNGGGGGGGGGNEIDQGYRIFDVVQDHLEVRHRLRE